MVYNDLDGNFRCIQGRYGFDAMVNDTPIKSLNISYSAAGAQEFGFTYPRIILFKTQDGRKGAIKIKDMVKNGTSSYILCDIKVQKQ